MGDQQVIGPEVRGTPKVGQETNQGKGRALQDKRALKGKRGVKGTQKHAKVKGHSKTKGELKAKGHLKENYLREKRLPPRSFLFLLRLLRSSSDRAGL